jgi:hypothetical protein
MLWLVGRNMVKDTMNVQLAFFVAYPFLCRLWTTS